MTNDKIISEFEKLLEQIKIQIDTSPNAGERTKNSFRLRQIKAALDIIKKYPKTIKTGEELSEYAGIGARTVSRINEILKDGKLSEIKVTKGAKKYVEYVEELTKIHGVGRSMAYNLITKHNIKTIKDLKKAYATNTIPINSVVATGLRFYDKYRQNIPRKEMDMLKEYLEKVVKTVDKKLDITICGSYRRLKPTSNDIDVLLFHPDIKTKRHISHDNNYLHQYVEKLIQNKFLLGNITDKDYEIKYMGYARLSSKYPVRRIDIRFIPYDSYHTALLYFTGSGEFNKKMRRIAESLGYLLNEYGLYKHNQESKIKIPITSEADVFEKLGMEYLDPEKRV